MKKTQFQVFECTNPECRLRFSSDLSLQEFDYCPTCSQVMKRIGLPYTNFFSASPISDLTEITLVLDNLRSTLNVGSIFRSAEGAGVRHIYCCGITPTPDHPKLKKSSLGAESCTPWSNVSNAFDVVKKLKSGGNQILALEYSPISTSLFEYQEITPLTVILGNEITGVDPELLSLADHILHIPMVGVKTSLNVAVAAGIAIYTLAERTRNRGKIREEQRS